MSVGRRGVFCVPVSAGRMRRQASWRGVDGGAEVRDNGHGAVGAADVGEDGVVGAAEVGGDVEGTAAQRRWRRDGRGANIRLPGAAAFLVTGGRGQAGS